MYRKIISRTKKKSKILDNKTISLVVFPVIFFLVFIAANITNAQSNASVIVEENSQAKSNSEGCTTFASVGSRNVGGGLLIAKNRDSMAEDEKLILTVPESGNKYVGIMYNVNGSTDFPQMSAGMNEKNLVVVNNAAASAKVGPKNNDNGQTWPIVEILKKYNSVDDVLVDKEKLFGTGLVNFLLLGDKNKILLVEIGENGKFTTEVKEEGVLFHTNHYISPELVNENAFYPPDSYFRLRRVRELLWDHYDYDFEYFWNISNDQHDGLENSIFRAWTVATMIVEIPANGSDPFLFVRFTSPKVLYTTFRININADFWKQEGVIKSRWLETYPDPINIPIPNDLQGKSSFLR